MVGLRGLIMTVSHRWYAKQMPGVFMEMLVVAPALEGGSRTARCCLMVILKGTS